MDTDRFIQRFEHTAALSDYVSLLRKPVSLDNCAQYKKVQDEKIHQLMVAAYEIPFYRKRFELSGTSPDDYYTAEDLYKFPLLTKSELRTFMEEEAEKNPGRYADWKAMSVKDDDGKLIRLLLSPSEEAWIWANWVRIMTLTGFHPVLGKTMYRPDAVPGDVEISDYTIQRFGFLRRRLMTNSRKQRIDLQTLIDAINAYQPDYLYHYKELLLDIATYVRRTGVYLWRPKYYTPLGGALSDEERSLLTEVFGIGLIEAYSTADVGYSLVRLPKKKYYQVLSDLYVLNIYDTSMTAPALNGTAVVTALYKTDLPVINLLSDDEMRTYIKKGLRFVRSISKASEDNRNEND